MTYSTLGPFNPKRLLPVGYAARNAHRAKHRPVLIRQPVRWWHSLFRDLADGIVSGLRTNAAAF